MELTEKLDCVEMKRRAAGAIHARLDGPTPEERAAYWREREAELLTPDELAKVRAAEAKPVLRK
jgi:hypothetical protein